MGLSSLKTAATSWKQVVCAETEGVTRREPVRDARAATPVARELVAILVNLFVVNILVRLFLTLVLFIGS
jgi:hypothetical protein